MGQLMTGSPRIGTPFRPRQAAVTIGSVAALLAAAALPMTAANAAPDSADDLGSASDYGVSANSEYAPVSSPTGAWFIELAGNPTARGGNTSTLANDRQTFLNDAAALGVDVEVRQTYNRLWNGVSANVSDDDAEVLRAAANVVAVYPVLEFNAPPTGSTTVPEMLSALAMTGADIVQSELGFTGEGVNVGIIDTGVDYDHPDLGGNGTDGSTTFPTTRVAYGYDFVGDDYNADDSSPAYQPVPRPDADPDDCQGHGTHVAGIVGANGDVAAGGIRGVAPGVTLGAYRVFGCDGSTTADVMLAAMERALADGMDVVNQSIGSAFAAWPEYPTAVASDNLVDAGVVMVASIGNDGASGLWAAGAPGVGNKVIGVASYDNTKFVADVFTVTPDGRAIPYNNAAESPAAPTSGALPLASAGTLACDPLDGDYTGQAVLIQRGTCSFYVKALAAQNAGAGAVVIYNNAPGMINATVAPTTPADPPITIPVVTIPLEDGLFIEDELAVGPVELTWTDQKLSVPNPTGGLISSFSSYGLTADLQLKPDLGAPGGQIYSTYPMELAGYATLSGTSMSSPHVAGAAALLLQAKPSTAPAQVRDLFQNSADPSAWSLNPALGLYEPVNRQGAGMLDVDDAILATTVVSPGKLSLGESEAGPATRTLTVTNSGAEAVTYTVSFEDAISTAEDPAYGDTPDNPGFDFQESIVDAPESVTVPAGSSVSFDVTISPSPDLVLAQYGGYISLTPATGAPLRVPYAGFAGDYQALPLLTPGDYDFPQLAQLTECSRLIGADCTMDAAWELRPDGATYSMADGDVPTVLVHLEHPASSLSIDIYNANADGTAGRPVHPAFHHYLDVDYLGRSGGQNLFTPYTWDGTRLNSNGQGRANAGKKTVPDGNYVLVFTVLAALGDVSNPDHVETYTTPAITIDRDGDGNPTSPGNGGGGGHGGPGPR